jgi:hypothetical protein
VKKLQQVYDDETQILQDSKKSTYAAGMCKNLVALHTAFMSGTSGHLVDLTEMDDDKYVASQETYKTHLVATERYVKDHGLKMCRCS